MANEIKAKFGAATEMVITLASLATSTAGVGRQSDLVSNTSDRFSAILLFVKVKLGTTPVANKGVYIHLIRDSGDVTPIRSDSAGTSDAPLTVLNSEQIGGLQGDNTTTSGQVLSSCFVIQDPGPKWGIAVHHDTGVNLDSTGSNHSIRFLGINPEVQ
jgi:hypothetical protein